MRANSWIPIAIALGSYLAGGAAMAVVHHGTILGDEAQATTCAVGSATQVLGTWSYDDVTGVVSWSLTYGDNAPSFDDGDVFDDGNALFAHFHGPAPVGVVSGNILIDLGTATPNVGSQTIAAGLGAELLAERWYYNLHSEVCTGGEVRGQLLVDAPPVVPSIGWPIGVALATALMLVGVWGVRFGGARFWTMAHRSR